MTKEKELIKHAACKAKNGMIFIGKHHGSCLKKALYTNTKMSTEIADRGFYTNKGRFLSIGDAAKLAVKNGQIKKKITYLFSEDLWGKDHGGKYEYCEEKGYHIPN